MHGPNLALAAVQTRHGPHCSYGRYSAFVPLSSSSPFDPRTPACHDAHTPRHHTHPGRHGCMLTVISLTYSDLTHAVFLTFGRSLTHGCSHTRAVSFTRTIPLTHAGGTHPRCFTHAYNFTRTRGLFHSRCPFHTRRAGKHASWHTRDHTTHTGSPPHTGSLSHTFLHSHHACVAARISPRS